MDNNEPMTKAMSGKGKFASERGFPFRSRGVIGGWRHTQGLILYFFRFLVWTRGRDGSSYAYGLHKFYNTEKFPTLKSHLV